MKVSDFKLAARLIKSVCANNRVPFVDVELSFNSWPAYDAAGEYNYDGKKLSIGKTTNLGQTFLTIFASYLNSVASITGKPLSFSDSQKTNLIKTATTIIRAFLHSPETLPEAWEKPVPAVSLSQFPVAWILMRDIVCPYKQAQLNDVRVVMGSFTQHDAASCGISDYRGVEEPVIFINTDIEGETYRTACLFASALTAHGLNPMETVRELISNAEVKDKFAGFVKMALVDEEKVTNFMFSLAASSDINLDETVFAPKAMSKQASLNQGMEGMIPGMGGTWFVPSLTEGLLGAAQHSDPAIHRNLEALNKGLWERVAAEKKKRGKVDMTMEDLLRVQSQESKVKPGILLQGLLSSQRIW